MTVRKNNLILVYGLSIPIAFFVAFLVYWLGFRDNWDIDNFAQINIRCQAVHDAAAIIDKNKADLAYNELLRFIGEHPIRHDFIAEAVQTAREAQLQCTEEMRQLRKQIVLAKKSGYDAFRKGRSIDQTPEKNGDAWVFGWNVANTEKEEKKAEQRRQQAKEEQKIAWLAGEARAREPGGYYSSYEYKYDLETLGQFHEQLQTLSSPNARNMQLKFADALMYKMERDKYDTIATHVEGYAIYTEADWLLLWGLSKKYGW